MWNNIFINDDEVDSMLLENLWYHCAVLNLKAFACDLWCRVFERVFGVDTIN